MERVSSLLGWGDCPQLNGGVSLEGQGGRSTVGPRSGGGDWTWFCGSLPAFPVLFSPLRASFRGFLHLLGLCHCFSPSAQSWIRGGPCRGLGALVPVCQAWPPCALPSPAGPSRCPPPAACPGRSVFPPGAEAKLVFLPCAGIAPQRHTMQLLKYLGLAGRAQRAPCSPRNSSLPEGAGGACLCWQSAGGEGCRETPEPPLRALHGGRDGHGCLQWNSRAHSKRMPA